MTHALDSVADTEKMGRPRRDKDEPRLIDQELAERLVTQAREQGIDLLGEDGLVKDCQPRRPKRGGASRLSPGSLEAESEV